MVLSDVIKSNIATILARHGSVCTVYLSPTYTYNDEGDVTAISLGTGTGTLAHSFSFGASITAQPEGLMKTDSTMIYMPYSVGTVTEKSIISLGGSLYIINKIEHNETDTSDPSFYEFNCELLKPQSLASV